MQIEIKQLSEWLLNSSVTCFYGGAGTSVASGIRDYRSRFGRWTELEEKGVSPLEYGHSKRLRTDPAGFFRDNPVLSTNAKPATTHKLLAHLEQEGHDIRVITQNIDGLHQAAGQRYVLELHGNEHESYCLDCHRHYETAEVKKDAAGIPRCDICQGIVRPTVVYFGDDIPKADMEEAAYVLKASDLLILAGTSLSTPVAKRLLQNFQGNHLVVINLEPVDIEPLAIDFFLEEPVDDVFRALQLEMGLDL